MTYKLYGGPRDGDEIESPELPVGVYVSIPLEAETHVFNGNAHTNKGVGQVLPERQIQTPHFHKVESDGRMIAFRTPFLEDRKNESLLKQDYQFGVTHFCQEARITGPNGTESRIQVICTSLPLSTPDPLTGVNFPI